MKTICIYCSSSNDVDESYLKTAEVLGAYLAINKVAIIYGGSTRGLMGALAKGALEYGGEVTGIITKKLYEKIGHQNESRLIVTDSMHQRKQKMFELSESFLALPGGFGTLDEIFEVITWKTLGYHDKPIAFFNLNNYFDTLFSFIKHARDEKFLTNDAWSKVLLINNEDELKKWFRN